MGGKFRQRQAIRRWVTRDCLTEPVCQAWRKRPVLERPHPAMSRIWVARSGSGGEHQDICADELDAMGIKARTDRPILVEFTARVVEEGSSDGE